MLSLIDRKSRVRRRTLEAHLPALAEPSQEADRELVLGMLQHLHDDQWFHSTPGFYLTTNGLGQLFRKSLGPDEDWNCGFLGHLVTELLLDAALYETHPGGLDAYYAACLQVDAKRIEQTVSLMATKPPMDLSRFIQLFIRERFLVDYASNERLLYRLNQVLRRIGARALPDDVLPVLQRGRELVRDAIPQLLPVEQFWEAVPDSTLPPPFSPPTQLPP